jgi:hypothetical protein
MPVTFYNQETREKKTWKTREQAAEELGVNKCTIVSLIYGKQNTIDGKWVIKLPRKIRTKKSIPVTLYDLNTGGVHHWESREAAAEELGVKPNSIYLLTSGKTDVLQGKWSATPEEKPVENYVTIDKEALTEVLEYVKGIRKYQKKIKNKSMQVMRLIEDSQIAVVFGVDKINTNQHGFDGLFLDSIPFEHKNNTYGTENYLDADYKDLSVRRVNKFGKGSLNVVTAFDGVGYPMYSVVYNSSPIYGILLNGQKNFRQNATVSFNDLLQAGAKVVTYEKSRKEALQDIMSEYPNCSLKLSDIYMEKDAMRLAKKAVSME